ncbi:hypothetical protein C8R44DRAFT_740063 [Mycena epipterygia]|nr:hypothetical protein C8R44DRAFT_740063 [Mycena epipterygia]
MCGLQDVIEQHIPPVKIYVANGGAFARLGAVEWCLHMHTWDIRTFSQLPNLHWGQNPTHLGSSMKPQVEGIEVLYCIAAVEQPIVLQHNVEFLDIPGNFDTKAPLTAVESQDSSALFTVGALRHSVEFMDIPESFDAFNQLLLNHKICSVFPKKQQERRGCCKHQAYLGVIRSCVLEF